MQGPKISIQILIPFWFLGDMLGTPLSPLPPHFRAFRPMRRLGLTGAPIFGAPDGGGGGLSFGRLSTLKREPSLQKPCGWKSYWLFSRAKVAFLIQIGPEKGKTHLCLRRRLLRWPATRMIVLGGLSQKNATGDASFFRVLHA